MTAPTMPVAWFCNPSQIGSLYLGLAGNMQKLPVPDAGYTGPLARAEIVHALASGGATVTRRRFPKRTYGLSWSALLPEQRDILTSFYNGSMGLGPYRLVDPTVRNHLSIDSASMGAPVQAIGTVWSLPSGDAVPYFDAAQALPTGVVGSGVLHWPTPVSTHRLVNGTYVGTVITPSNFSAVYLADQTIYVSVWLRTVSGSATFTLGLLGTTATGATSPASTTVTCAVTTTWQRFGFAIAPTASGFSNILTPLLMMSLTAPASAPDLLMCAAQLEYGQTVKANPWVQGEGCPRVSIGGPFGSATNVFWRRDSTLPLVEN